MKSLKTSLFSKKRKPSNNLRLLLGLSAIAMTSLSTQPIFADSYSVAGSLSKGGGSSVDCPGTLGSSSTNLTGGNLDLTAGEFSIPLSITAPAGNTYDFVNCRYVLSLDNHTFSNNSYSGVIVPELLGGLALGPNGTSSGTNNLQFNIVDFDAFDSLTGSTNFTVTITVSAEPYVAGS